MQGTLLASRSASKQNQWKGATPEKGWNIGNLGCWRASSILMRLLGGNFPWVFQISSCLLSRGIDSFYARLSFQGCLYCK